MVSQQPVTALTVRRVAPACPLASGSPSKWQVRRANGVNGPELCNMVQQQLLGISFHSTLYFFSSLANNRSALLHVPRFCLHDKLCRLCGCVPSSRMCRCLPCPTQQYGRTSLSQPTSQRPLMHEEPICTACFMPGSTQRLSGATHDWTLDAAPYANNQLFHNLV